MLNDKQNPINLSPMLNLELVQDEFQLNDEQKKKLADLYEGSLNSFQVGKIIEGKVKANSGDGILVDINYKSDGMIPSYEFTDYELKKFVVSTYIDVVIDRLEDENGSVVLSYQKAKSIKAWDKINELAAADEPVKGMVTHKVKGGLSVDIGIPAFLPGSQVDVQRVTDFDQFVGQEITAKILKVNKKRGNVIISRRKFIEEQKLEGKKLALESIQEGQVVQGIVKNITNYGAFIDIGGVDGLLHITDMSWGRISHPSELLKIGDTVTVKVLSFDKDHEKISLGMKQLASNPWENVGEKYSPGTKVKGRISSITDYGLFVEIEKGIEGLVHISEISWTERVSNLAKQFHVGQEIEAVVVALDKENRRMSLSIKQLKTDPWKVVMEKFKEGDRVRGEISNVTDFGIFVRLAEAVDGLIHVSDISWIDHVSNPAEKYKKGDVIDAVILSVDPEKRKISLGIKQLEKDPWEKVVEDYPVGKMVEGVVSKITNFGAFVKLPTGIEGLVHISELSDKEVGNIEELLKVGEKCQFKVIKVNKEERKLGLSLKATKESTKVETEAKTLENEAKESRRDSKSSKKEAKQTTSGAAMRNPLQQAIAEHREQQEKSKKDGNND